MARPQSKQALVSAATLQFEKLWDLIGSMPPHEQNADFCFGADAGRKEAHWARDKNLRDVLVHLYEWHMLLINWVAKNQSGQEAPFLPAPYNWKTYGQMNEGLWAKHQATPYTAAKELLLNSHARVMAVVEAFSNEELFSRRHFSFTGSSTLGSYCVSATASHYDWAMKKIKLHMKTCQKNGG